MSTSVPRTERPIPVRERGTSRITNPLDLAIAGGIGVWALLETLLVEPAHPLPQIVFALVISLPLIVRRRFPGAVMLIVAVALALHALAAGPDATFNPFPSLLVATFTVADRVAALWQSIALGLVPIAAMVFADRAGYFGSPGVELPGLLFLVFFVGAAWCAGRFVRARALAMQRVAQEAEEQAGEAASAERRRIARELHDIVAHSLSIVALQAAAAEQFLVRDASRARTHLQLTRRTAQSALDEMRHLLGLLEEEGASYAPQPGIESLRELIAETEAAGHRCTSEFDLVPGGIPDGVALAAFRIVQEALTNARKHAPGSDIAIVLHESERELVVSVSNDPATRRAEAPGAGGRGIPGMAERIRVYGGSFSAGPGDGGGWAVRASLPLGGAR